MKYAGKGDALHPPWSFAVKRVFTWDPRQRKARLFRVLWTVGEGPGTTRGGWASRLSISLQHPSEYGWVSVHGHDQSAPPTRKHWRFKFFGLALHFRRHYGGWPT